MPDRKPLFICRLTHRLCVQCSLAAIRESLECICAKRRVCWLPA